MKLFDRIIARATDVALDRIEARNKANVHSVINIASYNGPNAVEREVRRSLDGQCR